MTHSVAGRRVRAPADVHVHCLRRGDLEEEGKEATRRRTRRIEFIIRLQSGTMSLGNDFNLQVSCNSATMSGLNRELRQNTPGRGSITAWRRQPASLIPPRQSKPSHPYRSRRCP
ncbi:hypothetical protein GWI33_004252 [Rhynchophorus ferrugineus]|uniref:Uncharacterized protein n=1 Tax=Rhynchophorus ferrugineus TaxID=354439 RepID=A0A834MFM0_RHYFE|nr:hypothetical protein GWI33_004252 [Rhynchophorus ferrugineus]